MKNTTIPSGYHTITPYLTILGAADLMGFLKRAFAAREKECFTQPDGTIGHAEMIIGDSIIMLGEPKKDCKPMAGSFYLYVDKVDAVYQQALTAGATSAMEPANQFWGDRIATVHDRFGNIWHVATRIEDVSHEELKRRIAAMEG
jgi:PhnB protein